MQVLWHGWLHLPSVPVEEAGAPATYKAPCWPWAQLPSAWQEKAECQRQALATQERHWWPWHNHGQHMASSAGQLGLNKPCASHGAAMITLWKNKKKHWLPPHPAPQLQAKILHEVLSGAWVGWMQCQLTVTLPISVLSVVKWA